MAKTNGNGDAPAVELSKADAAKLVKGKVVVPMTDGNGQPIVVRPKEGGSYFKTEELAIRPEHILSFRLDGNEVVVVTVDGQKLRASLA